MKLPEDEMEPATIYDKNPAFMHNHYSGIWGMRPPDPGHIMDNWLSNHRSMAHSYARTHKDIEEDKTIAGVGGLGAAGFAVKTLGLGAIKTATIGLGIGMSGPAAAIMGVAGIAAGGAIGALVLKEASPYAIKTLKGTGKITTNLILATGKNAAKMTAAFLEKSYEALKNTHASYDKNAKTKSAHLEKVDEATKQRETKFKSFITTAKSELKNGKDIKEGLQQLHKLKMPTNHAKKELHKLTADWLIKNNKKGNTLDVKGMKKQLKAFSKETRLSKKEAIELRAGVYQRLEEHKDNFVIDKNNQFTNLKANRQTANGIAKEITKTTHKRALQQVLQQQKQPQQQKQAQKQMQQQAQQQVKQQEISKDMGKEQGR